jgi:peptidyl-prolyl cis-trans isomerase D
MLCKYKDDNIKASFKYAFLDLNSVTDSNQYQVSEEEMKSYFNEHKDEFKQDAAVKFKYIIFSDAATLEDSNSLKRQMDYLVKDVKIAKLEDSTLIKLVNENSSAPFKAEFQKPSQIGATGKLALNFLFSAKPEETSDVLIDQDGYKIIKLLESKDGEDTYVNASHILINFGTDTAAAKKQAENVLKLAKSGESFEKLAMELSQDPSAKQNSGDLGWFTKGAMVKEFEDATMNGKPGEIIGPVKTQFGFHIIKIKDKSKKEFKFAEIKKTVTAGQRTKDIARKKAQEFLSDVENGAILDSLAKNMTLPLLTTPEISKGGFVPGAGQNKNIIDFGLANKKSKLYGPAKVQGGFAIYMITEKIAEGYKNYDSVKVSLVKPKIAQTKKFNYLQKFADDIRNKATGGDILALQSTFPQYSFANSDSVSISKPDPKLGLDYPLYNAIFSMKPGEVSKSIKGTRGYYVAVLNWITPFDQNDYIVKQTDIRKQLLSTKKQQSVQEWMQNLTNNAKIDDNRDKYL